MDIIVGKTPEEAAYQGTRLVTQLARDAASARGRFAVALTGGAGPRALYRALAHDPSIDWKTWEVYFGDERAVSTMDEASNFRQADDLLLAQVPLRAERVHPMYSLGMDPDEAAREYEALLAPVLGAPPVFDLVMLGVGTDGHTLSLYPGCPAIDERARSVVALLAPPMDPPLDRITFTPPVVWAARHVLVVAHGASKAKPVQKVIEGDEDRLFVPAQLVRDATGQVTFLLDQPAASLLTKR